MEEARFLELWINKKNGNEYQIIRPVTNATNDQDGQKMILYAPYVPGADVPWYCREKSEFYEKFVKKEKL